MSAADLAVVEDVGAAPGDQPVRRREVGVALDRARPRAARRRAGTARWSRRTARTRPRCRRPAAGTWRPPRSPARRPGRPARSRLPSDRLPHRSAAASQVASVPGTPTDRPLTRASWKAYGRPVAGSMKWVSVIVAGPASRPSIVCTVRAPGVVVDEEPAAADAGRERLRDAERGGGRDGGVDRVAAAAQHVEPDRGGRRVHRGHGAAVAGGGRHLRRR